MVCLFFLMLFFLYTVTVGTRAPSSVSRRSWTLRQRWAFTAPSGSTPSCRCSASASCSSSCPKRAAGGSTKWRPSRRLYRADCSVSFLRCSSFGCLRRRLPPDDRRAAKSMALHRFTFHSDLWSFDCLDRELIGGFETRSGS